MTQPSTQLHQESIAPESFAKAYANGFRLTVRFLLSKGANADSAEELAQTAWVRGWEARSQLRFEERILPWINSIAYRRFCSDRRYAMRFSELADLTEPTAPAPSAVLDAGILLRLCSPSDRRILKQRYLEDMEIKEIAEVSGLTETAVRVRIHRCRRSLRSRITKVANRGRTGYAALQRRGAAAIRAAQSQQRAA